MASSKSKTVSEYLASLPADRRKVISKVRSVVKKNLPPGFKEVMNWGMITYEVPLKTYPETYNGQPLMFAGLASQKNHMGLYLMCVYGDKALEKQLKEGFKKSGKKLDMGKSCVRFKKLEELPLDIVSKVIASTSLKKFIASYEASRKR